MTARTFIFISPTLSLCFSLTLFSPGEEEQGSMAEVSYYSYEYDPDSDPFLADAEGGDHFDLPEGSRGVEHNVLLPVDSQLPTLDTKNTPERWYELHL